MPRPLAALAAVVVLSSVVSADEPKPDPVELALGVQTAMAAADEHLKANRPAEAVAALEARVADADGSRAFLALLRKAYTAALADPAADPTTAARLRRRLDLLGGADAAPAPAPVLDTPGRTPGARPAVAAEPVADARRLFKQGRYAEAAAAFQAAVGGQAEVTPEEVAAWAYCRVKLAADAVNRPACDGPTAAAAAADLAEALKLAPANAALQQVGQQVLALARLKSGGSRPAVASDVSAVPSDWGAVESANFRVRFQGDRAAAEALAAAAEASRAEVAGRWGGPAGAWSPKCELVLHPSADCYARMTGRPAAGTGHATVTLADGKATARRVDLRADDDTRDAVALPRELTHVVLADLFPYSPPPKWAATGMAVLSGPAAEVGRYARELPACAGRGELVAVGSLLEAKEFPPADKITGFYCQSTSVVDYLVRLKGEKTFVLFLRESGRYGAARSLKTQYGLDGPAALEAAWRRAALDGARAQSP